MYRRRLGAVYLAGIHDQAGSRYGRWLRVVANGLLHTPDRSDAWSWSYHDLCVSLGRQMSGQVNMICMAYRSRCWARAVWPAWSSTYFPSGLGIYTLHWSCTRYRNDEYIGFGWSVQGILLFGTVSLVLLVQKRVTLFVLLTQAGGLSSGNVGARVRLPRKSP